MVPYAVPMRTAQVPDESPCRALSILGEGGGTGGNRPRSFVRYPQTFL